ncbi:DgyrCDS14323 [Dimorphilus gyrociliatus]|uniref:Vinculin n=1 Tax=Dimorphilus gyrociliatus TaxID=2664684 RepID=A0A7I8WDL0_9ANNE|nr:DgyrCDS14323 [Dimorphilus gyrociliatus]
MPTFHTKTIETILEPVAQQVSKLVILHEEGEDGNAMPDLTRPVNVVKKAVDNLVKVGYETVSCSEDNLLKHDMPPALSRVEEASMLLVNAASMLLDDSRSAPARKKLIDGSRGILHGTSALLLAFDESEVRKIIRKCKTVLEYLEITEVISTLEDLVKYIETLSPNLTSMIKSVESRERELMHQAHREMLLRSVDDIRNYTNLFVNTLKIFVTAKVEGQFGIENAQHNRDYVVKKMTSEINEIIRVLRLTSHDDDDWDLADINSLKKAHNFIKSKLPAAIDWVQDVTSLPGGSGEHNLRQVLETAKKFAEACSDPEEKEDILRMAGEIQSLVDSMCELREQRKGDTPQALTIIRTIKDKFGELNDMIQKSISNAERAGMQRPDPSFLGKLDQAKRWLANPMFDDRRLGEQAARMAVEEGRRIADTLQGAEKADLLRTCDEVESLTNQLANLVYRGEGNSPLARQIVADLSRGLEKLSLHTQDAIAQKVADDFMDTTSAVKHLTEAAKNPLNTPGRNEVMKNAEINFEEHARRITQAATVAAFGASQHNKALIQELNNKAIGIKNLAPEVIHAARMVHANPNNESANEHFNMIKSHWEDDVNRLKNLVDGVVDTGAFIKANKRAIQKETVLTEKAIEKSDPGSVVANTFCIGKRSKRVMEVAEQEVENSEDPQLVNDVGQCVRKLEESLPPMVHSAKKVVNNTKDQRAVQDWRNNNNKLINAIDNVGLAVQRGMPKPTWEPEIDLDRMHIDDESAPPRPPLPSDSAPPRPPPPSDTEDDEPSFPEEMPNENQPIMQAAHALHMDVKQWSSRDNDIIAAAKEMAILMANLSQLVRGESSSKKELIATAKAIAEASERVTKLAKKLAMDCTDKRMRMNLLQVCERIPTIGTQLKILSTVKATMLGAQETVPIPDDNELASGSEEDQEATEMLVGNAQNLMQSVRDTVRAAEAASIKIRIDSGYTIRWHRRKPWYT